MAMTPTDAGRQIYKSIEITSKGCDMGKFCLTVYRSLMFLSCVSLLGAFAAIMLGVVAREMRWDIQGLDAYAGYAIAAALFLALPSTLQHGDHIRVSLLLQRASKRTREALEYWALVAGLGLAVFMTWYSVQLVMVSYLTHDLSPAADATPLWIPQIAMVAGCAGFALAFLHALVSRVRGRSFFIDSSSANFE